MRCVLLTAVKMGGVRYPPGVVLDVPDEIYERFPDGTAQRTKLPLTEGTEEGPTFEDFIKAGNLPEEYPPEGCLPQDTAGWREYRGSRKAGAIQEAGERAARAEPPTKPKRK